MMETPRFGQFLFPNQEAESEEQIKRLKEAGELYESRMAARRGTLLKKRGAQTQNNRGGGQARGGKRRNYGQRNNSGGQNWQQNWQAQWQPAPASLAPAPAAPNPAFSYPGSSNFQPRGGQQGNQRGGQRGGRRPYYRH